jgi:hypothetical protein
LEREELYHLFVHVQAGAEWQRQEYLPGGGPVVGECRAVPIDLRGVDGDTVRLRLQPPIGFWSLNSFELGWEEQPVQLARIFCDTARDERGRDVRAALESDDDLYVDFPTTRHQVRLEFKAPPPSPGRERRLFAACRGWYEVHLPDSGRRDDVALERLRSEPGAIVRMGLDEFAELERTGMLGGAGHRPSGGR